MGAASQPPTATVQTRYLYGIVGETVTLRGTGTDPENGPLTYTWRVNTGDSVSALSLNDSVVQVSAASAGRRVVVFTVYDSGYLSARDTAVVFFADTIPSLTAAGSSALISTPLSLDTSAALFNIAGANEVTARCILQSGGETAEVTVVVDLASGYENSRLVIARVDSSTMRRGTDNLLYFDSFARFLVELHLISPAGASIGSQSGVFDRIELRVDPRTASIGSDLLARLGFFTFDEASGKWVALTGGTSEGSGDRTRFRQTLSHFSFYTLAVPVAAAATLGNFTVYPNPWVPGDGNPLTGVEYQAGVANTGITFENIPVGSDLKVYTPLGELVAQWIIDASGGAQWDVRNRRGERAASGIYVYVVRTPQGERRVGKFAVVR